MYDHKGLHLDSLESVLDFRETYKIFNLFCNSGFPQVTVVQNENDESLSSL